MKTTSDIVDIAREWIGTPYRHRMSKIGLGCDCLGLLRGVWRTYYQCDDPVKLPNYSPTWLDHRKDDPLITAVSQYLESIPQKDLQAGSVVLFRIRDDLASKHCAILSAPDKIIHAFNGIGVIEQPFDVKWQRRVTATFRFRNR